MVESHYVAVNADQGVIGTSISGNFQPTPAPAALTVDVEGGTYLLSWYSEVMRTSAGGGATVFARLRDTTASYTHGFMRRGMVGNGPPGNIPDDPDFFLSGDLFPFGGSAIVTLPAGLRTYRLEYALSTSITPSEALRAQHQRITLMRLD